MSHRSIIILLFLLFLLMGFMWTPNNYPTPTGWPIPMYSFQTNPYDTAQGRLGKYLFYDPVLSKDSTISCASCHSPYNAFAHTDHPTSHGIDDRKGKRNAPALFNLAWNKNFMWDGAIHHLDFQAIAPITGKTEMDNNLENVVLKIKKQKRYVLAFQEIFPNQEITANLILRCLSQFQLSLISAQSKYDLVQNGVEIFSNQESNGQRLYTAHCADCHTAPLFTNQELMYSKIPNNAQIDSGRYSITHLDKDTFLFKVPSLRNLSFTYPYFHDGHQPQLRAAIREHGKMIHDQYQLSEDEISMLISFLKTLDDPTFVFNPEHQFPKNFFRKK
jgi:cytochrome c peroxidase